MALVNSAFTVNVTPGAMPPVVHVSEYDTGRTYTVTINGENGGAFVIPTGASATIEGTLNGEIGFSTTATIANNAVSFTLTESMTAKSGKAWCKIKLTLNDEPIQTCAFVLDVDRAGVEADTVIGADGFETQIVNAVNDWLDEHPPASGGMTEEFKQALLDCFENVAWINDQGQNYYDALYAALYHPADLVSISAVFNQGSAVIYDTDDLETLRQYLTVTATMSDSTTRTVTDYTLSGTLAVGTSTITVTYSGKTDTFNVTVSAYWDYQWDYTMGKLEEQPGWTLDSTSDSSSSLTGTAERIITPSLSSYYQPFMLADGELVNIRTFTNSLGVLEVTFIGHYSTALDYPNFEIRAVGSTTKRVVICINQNGKFVLRSTTSASPSNEMVLADYTNDTECTVKIVYKGETADLYINGELAYPDISTSISQFGKSSCAFCQVQGSGYYTDLKSLKIKSGSY